MEEKREDRKPCLKCLLRELDERAYMEKLHRYIELLDVNVKAPKGLYEDRLAVCKTCEYAAAMWNCGRRSGKTDVLIKNGGRRRRSVNFVKLHKILERRGKDPAVSR